MDPNMFQALDSVNHEEMHQFIKAMPCYMTTDLSNWCDLMNACHKNKSHTTWLNVGDIDKKKVYLDFNTGYLYIKFKELLIFMLPIHYVGGKPDFPRFVEN